MDDLYRFIENVKNRGLEATLQRYYSIYRAKVVSNEDPEKRGRVKVQVPSLFGENDLAALAEPKDFRGAGPNKGEFYPPDVDDWVYVEFEMGDERFPIYSGGWYGEVSEGQSELKTDEFTHEGDIPKVRGFMNKYGHVFKFSEEEGKQKVHLSTPKGHYFVLDDTEGSESIFLIHKSGAQFQVDAKGSVRMLAQGAFVSVDGETGAISMASKDGSTAAIDDGITLLDSSGGSLVRLSGDGAQMNSQKDLILSGNTATVSAGAITLDAITSKLKLGSGKVALGAGPTEIFDSLIKVIDALLNAPTLVPTPAGPSGPISPPAQVQLTLIKTLLSVVKGTL